MKNNKNLFISLFLIVCTIGMLIVRYCYDQTIINSTTAIILNKDLGFLCTAEIIYSLIMYNKKIILTLVCNWVLILEKASRMSRSFLEYFI